MNMVAPVHETDNDSSNLNDASSFGDTSHASSKDSRMAPQRAGSAHGSEDSATNVGQRGVRPNSIGSLESHRMDDLPGNPLIGLLRRVASFFNYFWSQGAVEQRIVEVVAIAGTQASEARPSQKGHVHTVALGRLLQRVPTLCGGRPGSPRARPEALRSALADTRALPSPGAAPCEDCANPYPAPPPPHTHTRARRRGCSTFGLCLLRSALTALQP